MRILYIHDQNKIRTGAHHFNSMLIKELRRAGHKVDNIYPRKITSSVKSVNEILFFHSLIQKKREAYKYDLIQGTTFTTLAFLDNGTPTVAHFGSTNHGFIKSVPTFKGLEKEKKELGEIFREFKKNKIIKNINPPVPAGLKNVGDIEVEVAQKSTAVVAASSNLKKELAGLQVPLEKINVIHNAIEDFWFKTKLEKRVKKTAELLYLGRMGDDAFTIKLKGIDRLIYIYRQFPKLKKTVIGMCGRKENEFRKLLSEIPNTLPVLNARKKIVLRVINSRYGDIYVNPGRYEGFCLSLIEAMSQGLVPVIFPIGVAPEIIENGKNGYIVNSIEEMEEKIKYLAGKKALRAKMAEAAMETSKMFTPEKIIPRFIRLYEKLNREAKYGGLVSFLENAAK